MTTTNSVKLVFHNGDTATVPIPVFDRDEIKSMTFILGWTSVVLSKTSPSAVEVVVHQLDQQQPPPPPPPPPPASEEENITEIVVQNKEMPPPASEEENITEIVVQNKEIPPPASEEENITEPKVPDKGINHEKPEQGASGLMISPDTRNLIMVVAALFLQMAYQAGLNPPGGFWPDDLVAAADGSSAMAAPSLAPAPLGGENGGDAVVLHQAGDPILRSENRNCYLEFEWLNSLSLVCSSMLILILMTLSFVRSREVSDRGLLAAMTIMYIDLLIILQAYRVGAVTHDNGTISVIPHFVVGMALACMGVLFFVYWIRRTARRQNN